MVSLKKTTYFCRVSLCKRVWLGQIAQNHQQTKNNVTYTKKKYVRESIASHRVPYVGCTIFAVWKGEETKIVGSVLEGAVAEEEACSFWTYQLQRGGA